MVALGASEAAARTFLRKHVLFAGVSEEDFDRIVAMAKPVHLKAGQVLLEEGAAGNSLYVVVEGDLEISRKEGGRNVVLAIRGPGEFVGELSLLQGAPRSATARACSDAELLEIERPAFQSLLACTPQATLTILGTVTARLQSTEALLMQQEKLAGLGTMAAGLAHELNNPAAAIRRSVDQLRRTVPDLTSATMALAGLGIDARALEAARSPAPPALDALARSRAEEELQDALEAAKIDRAWDLAAPLAASGLTPGRLQELRARFPGAQLEAVIRWLAAQAEVEALASEATTSAAAISSIVTAVKSYTRLDQMPIQDLDVHETLESTLVILKHKLTGARVVRDFAPGLPRIEAHGSELAQVWTNLIDNAVDAGGKTITLRTRPATGGQASGGLVVEIEDDGPGIPADKRDRVFEPFFTTKAPGHGTGLGLHIVRNIVVDHHGGQIELESQPGLTRFQVRLPLQLPRR